MKLSFGTLKTLSLWFVRLTLLPVLSPALGGIEGSSVEGLIGNHRSAQAFDSGFFSEA